MICVVCGDPIIHGQQWLILNRFVVSNGKSHAFVERKDKNGVSVWDTEREIACGHVAHWPICATTLIEGEILNLNVRARVRGLNP